MILQKVCEMNRNMESILNRRKGFGWTRIASLSLRAVILRSVGLCSVKWRTNCG